VTTHWIHGNALRVESPFPRNSSGSPLQPLDIVPLGWGTQVSIPADFGESWYHIPIPMPSDLSGRTVELLTAYLLFDLDHSSISDVHIWDGAEIVQEFGDLFLSGNHLARDSRNQFRLRKPHRILHGIGLSFFIRAGGGFEGASASRLVVAGAGADVRFQPGSLVDRLTRAVLIVLKRD
jgi:hypothetical protein